MIHNNIYLFFLKNSIKKFNFIQDIEEEEWDNIINTNLKVVVDCGNGTTCYYNPTIINDLGVELIFGSHPDDILDSSYDYLIKNPGVPIDHKYVLKARELGIEVINELEMAYRLLPNVKFFLHLLNIRQIFCCLFAYIIKYLYNHSLSP